MKKICIFAVALILVAATQTHAQQGKYVNSSAARLVKMIDAANDNGYKLQSDGFSVGGAWLKQGKDHWVPVFTKTFKRGTNYRLIAVGDMDARDVDIQVLDSTGRVVASDTATSPEAIVNFTPTENGNYTIRLRLYASKNNVPSMCLAIVMER